jgi:hypothetical protein
MRGLHNLESEYGETIFDVLENVKKHGRMFRDVAHTWEAARSRRALVMAARSHKLVEAVVSDGDAGGYELTAAGIALLDRAGALAPSTAKLGGRPRKPDTDCPECINRRAKRRDIVNAQNMRRTLGALTGDMT